MKR
ncbi:Protein of unknown function [Bacillus toyonensis]|jgi:hypothetical protein